MDYLELINRYWNEVDMKGWSPVETNIYFRLLEICHRSGWENPFSLPNTRAVALMSITENTLCVGRESLARKGLIRFKKGSRRSNPPMYCFPEKINEDWVFPDDFIQEYKVKSDLKQTEKLEIEEIPRKEKPLEEFPIVPYKENPPQQPEVKTVLPTRTQEEIELEKFDRLLQEVVDGKHQIWIDEMRKKQGIDDVVGYLPSFRSHAIANARIYKVTNINDFKQYFNVSFRYFVNKPPIETLMELRDKAEPGKDFYKFCEWMQKTQSNVARNLTPLTEAELNYLVNTFTKQKVFKAIMDMNNNLGFVEKYFSLYTTLINWLRNER